MKVRITSAQNEKVKYFNRLKDKKFRDQERKYLIEDVDLLNIAIEKGLVETILYYGEVIITNTDTSKIEMIEVTEDIINKLSSLSSHVHFVAVCRMRNMSNAKDNFVIALDNVQDPGNGGTILRSALAFNFEEMLLSEGCFDAYNDKFIRSTKGAFYDLPVKRVNLENELLARKISGYKIAVCDMNPKAINVKDFEMPNRLVLVVGSEGLGVSKAVKRIADYTIFIPMNEKMESLNVAIAASIVMHRLSEKNG